MAHGLCNNKFKASDRRQSPANLLSILLISSSWQLFLQPLNSSQQEMLFSSVCDDLYLYEIFNSCLCHRNDKWKVVPLVPNFHISYIFGLKVKKKSLNQHFSEEFNNIYVQVLIDLHDPSILLRLISSKVKMRFMDVFPTAGSHHRTSSRSPITVNISVIYFRKSYIKKGKILFSWK